MLGTPGFVGERLIQAREARELTAVALSEMIAVRSANISQYEHGKQSPSPSVLEKLSQILNLPPSFFLRPLPHSDMLGIAYRSMSSATKSARSRAEARFSWLKEIGAYLVEFLDFPTLNIPKINLSEDPTKVSMDEIEQITKVCRKFWKLGESPIADVVLLLENNGILVSRGELGAQTLDAFSQWPLDEPRPYIFLGSDKASMVRSRFDALHELGHVLLHRNVDRKLLKNNVTYSLMEHQCHRFASAMLLPQIGFAKDLFAPTLDSFLALKSKWGVSIAGQIKRSEELGILDDVAAKRSWINLNRRGWRKQEPLDDRLPVENPRLLKRSVKLIIDSGLKTKSQLISDLCLNPNDIEALVGLPRDYFQSGETSAAVPRLKSDGKPEGTLLQFEQYRRKL